MYELQRYALPSGDRILLLVVAAADEPSINNQSWASGFVHQNLSQDICYFYR